MHGLTCTFVANLTPFSPQYSRGQLEYLGDAVLGLLASRWLLEHFPEAAEGELTMRCSGLV